MSRRLRACTYCGRPADTKDHVPPQAFLRPPLPATLRSVPSCKPCNGGRSDDENYVRSLLAEVGTSQHATDLVSSGGTVDRAMARDRRLASRIDDTAVINPSGERVAVIPENAPIARVLHKIAHGLFVLDYRRNPGRDAFRVIGMFPYSIEDQRPATIFVSTFDARFRAKRWKSVQAGAFEYIFLRHPASGSRMLCVMDFHQDVWGVVESPSPLAGRPPASVGQPTLL